MRTYFLFLVVLFLGGVLLAGCVTPAALREEHEQAVMTRIVTSARDNEIEERLNQALDRITALEDREKAGDREKTPDVQSRGGVNP